MMFILIFLIIILFLIKNIFKYKKTYENMGVRDTLNNYLKRKPKKKK